MSDEKITHVDVTPLGAATAAANAYVRAHLGEAATGRHYAGMIAAAVDAWCSAAKVELPQATVRLLRPAPGDTVLFHVSGMSMQQRDEFLRSLEPLREQHPGVLFTASDAVDEISIVRSLTEQADGPTGLEKLRQVANRVASHEEFGQITRGETNG